MTLSLCEDTLRTAYINQPLTPQYVVLFFTPIRTSHKYQLPLSSQTTKYLPTPTTNMSGLMDKISGAAESKLGQDSQPGDGVERSADNTVNQGMFQSLFHSCRMEIEPNRTQDWTRLRVTLESPSKTTVCSTRLRTRRSTTTSRSGTK
jgi:hypothetical protein